MSYITRQQAADLKKVKLMSNAVNGNCLEKLECRFVQKKNI